MYFLPFLPSDSPMWAQSPWSAPALMATLSWGSGEGQLGWKPGFMGDSYPDTAFVDGSGTMVFADPVNFRILVMNPNGTLQSTIGIPAQERALAGRNPDEDGWPSDLILNADIQRILVTSQYSAYATIYDYKGNIKGRFVDPFYGKASVGIYPVPQGFVLVRSKWNAPPEYYTCDADGGNLRLRPERPSEMGICSGSGAETTVTFPGHVLRGAAFEGYCTDPAAHFLLADNGDLLTSYSYDRACGFKRHSAMGELLGEIELPKEVDLTWDEHHETPTSYVIYNGRFDPHGNIYATKAVRNGSVMEPLQILKWTWTSGQSAPTRSGTKASPQVPSPRVPERPSATAAPASPPEAGPEPGKKPPVPQVSGKEAAAEKKPIA